MLTWKSQTLCDNETATCDINHAKATSPFTDQFIFNALINQPNSKPVLCGLFLPNHSDTLTSMGV